MKVAKQQDFHKLSSSLIETKIIFKQLDSFVALRSKRKAKEENLYASSYGE
jgi:hypothetical protein